MALSNKRYLDSSCQQDSLGHRPPFVVDVVGATKAKRLRRVLASGHVAKPGSRLREAHRRRRPKGLDAVVATWHPALLRE
jgi:hypothetical protein